jgi:thioredoxin reductase (NADPH)
VADDAAFPTLDDAQLAALDALGTRRSVAAGEYLYREGDATYDFYVIVSGAVDVVIHTDGEERLIARHGAGRFLGELNMLTGLRVFVSARVIEPGEVIVVPAAELRRVLATRPGLGDTILAAFIARRAALRSGASAAIRVVGSRFSPEAQRIREFLARIGVPHEWLDPDHDADVERLLAEVGVPPAELPVVIVSGTVLRRPTPGALADYLGLTIGDLPDPCFDLVIVGGGPAGLAAAVYARPRGCEPCASTWSRPAGRPVPARASRTTSGFQPAYRAAT